MTLTRFSRRIRRPSERRAGLRFEGLEDRCLLAGGPAITEFPLPSPGGNEAYQIVAGADGNLWFSFELHGYIGKINPATDAVTEFALPTANDEAWAIAAGPDGNVWFTDVNHVANVDYIGMINLTTDAITEYTLHSSATLLRGITAGPDGNVWFTDAGTSSIGMINPNTHAITEFAVPNGSNIWGITAGPDGNLWFTSTSGSMVGSINPTTHAVSEFATPTPNAYPEGITAGPDGNIWFAEVTTSQIGEMNLTTHAITEYPVAGGAFEITAGSDGNLWFRGYTSGQIGKINPATDAVNEYVVPYTSAEPGGITAGPDGNVWFTDLDPYSNYALVGVVNRTKMQLEVTQEPPASVTAGSSFGLTVEAQDTSGNLDTSFSGPVTLALANNPDGATLGGTLTVTASGGVATFSNLSLTAAVSGYTLQATSSGFFSAITTAITVTPAAATQVVITEQPPASVKVNSDFGLQAAIEDAYSNVETSDSDTVKVALANNPTGAKLGGTVSKKASNGVATFSNLTINTVGTGYTIQVSDGSLTAATTNAINVTKTSAISLFVPGTTPGPNTLDPLVAPLVLDSPDFWGGLGLKKRTHGT